MSRRWRLFLQDMEQAIDKIGRYTAGRTLDTLRSDEMAFDATLRNLEVLGQAAKGIPESVRERFTDVDWRGIAGLRDVLAHAYFALDDDTLWDVIQNKIPGLREQLELIHGEEE